MNTQYCPSFLGELHSDVNVCPHLSHKWPPMQNMSKNFPYHCTWRIFQTKISSEVLHLEIMSNKKNFCRYFAYVSEFIIYTNIPATLRIAYIARENACIKTGGNLCIFFLFWIANNRNRFVKQNHRCGKFKFDMNNNGSELYDFSSEAKEN